MALPDWEKELLFRHEQDRVKRLKEIMDHMKDSEMLYPEAYATFMQSMFG